jgi:hypothetical protein
MRISQSLWFLALLVSTAVPALAQDRVDCNAVTTLAQVGINDRNRVATTIDRNRKECRFSIDGSPVAGAPRQAVDAGHDLITKKAMGKALQARNVDGLAFALLGASPEQQIAADLRTRLLSEAPNLAKCFDTLDRPKETFPVFTRNGVMCGVMAANETSSLRTVDGQAVGSVLRQRRALLVGATSGAFEYYLSVPEP